MAFLRPASIATSLVPLLCFVVAGCEPAPPRGAGQGGTKTAQNEAPAEPSEELTEAERYAPAGAGKHIDAEPAEPLTDEEKRLIAADPKDLSKEERRQRAFAMRKKIMQNPDSEQAQTILQGAEALRRGDVAPPFPIEGPTSEDTEKKGMMVYPAPGTEGEGKKKPEGDAK